MSAPPSSRSMVSSGASARPSSNAAGPTTSASSAFTASSAQPIASRRASSAGWVSDSVLPGRHGSLPDQAPADAGHRAGEVARHGVEGRDGRSWQRPLLRRSNANRPTRSAISLAALEQRGKVLAHQLSGHPRSRRGDVDRVGPVGARGQSDGAGRQSLLELAFGQGVAAAAGRDGALAPSPPSRQRARGQGAVGLGAQQLPGLVVGQLGQETLPQRGGVGLQPKARWGIDSQQAPARGADEIEHPPALRARRGWPTRRSPRPSGRSPAARVAGRRGRRAAPAAAPAPPARAGTRRWRSHARGSARPPGCSAGGRSWAARARAAPRSRRA